MNLGLPRWLSGKESACHSEDTGDLGLIPGWGRSPGGGHDNPLQYSCLENPMDRGGWWALIHRVTKSQTRLKWLNTNIYLRASSVAQRVKNLPAMQETWVRFLSWEDPLEGGMTTHSSILAWRIPMDRGAWRATVHGMAESDTTEWLSTHSTYKF